MRRSRASAPSPPVPGRRPRSRPGSAPRRPRCRTRRSPGRGPPTPSGAGHGPRRPAPSASRSPSGVPPRAFRRSSPAPISAGARARLSAIDAGRCRAHAFAAPNVKVVLGVGADPALAPRMLPMPTSVVTGGAGFLGSHLCEHLLAEGHRVICVDNLDTGSLSNIEHIRDDAFAFVNHDVTAHIDLPEAVDFVFHFASPASPIDYLRLPLHTLKVGAYGTHNALGLAKFKRARFVLASTSEVYGDPLQHPQPESYWGNVNPIGPRGVY